MLKIGNKMYVLDLDALEKTISSKITDDVYTENETFVDILEDGNLLPKTQRIFSKPKPREIDISKFEIIRDLLEIIYSYNEDADDSLGAERVLGKATIPFKIAFNTLEYYGIIKTL